MPQAKIKIGDGCKNITIITKTYYLKSSSESGPGDLGLSGWEGVGAGEEGRGAANSDMSEASMS